MPTRKHESPHNCSIADAIQQCRARCNVKDGFAGKIWALGWIKAGRLASETQVHAGQPRPGKQRGRLAKKRRPACWSAQLGENLWRRLISGALVTAVPALFLYIFRAQLQRVSIFNTRKMHL